MWHANSSACMQVNVGIAWISALATLILVPSDIYHAMQACFSRQIDWYLMYNHCSISLDISLCQFHDKQSLAIPLCQACVIRYNAFSAGSAPGDIAPMVGLNSTCEVCTFNVLCRECSQFVSAGGECHTGTAF